MSGHGFHEAYLFEICVRGWEGTNCDGLYVKLVFKFFRASGSSCLHRKFFFLDVAFIVCVRS